MVDFHATRRAAERLKQGAAALRMTEPPTVAEIDAAIRRARAARAAAIADIAGAAWRWLNRTAVAVRALVPVRRKCPSASPAPGSTVADRWFADGRGLFGRDDH